MTKLATPPGIVLINEKGEDWAAIMNCRPCEPIHNNLRSTIMKDRATKKAIRIDDIVAG